jgi:hypothetical protein
MNIAIGFLSQDKPIMQENILLFVLANTEILESCDLKLFCEPILKALNSKKPHIRKICIRLLKLVAPLTGLQRFFAKSQKLFKPSIQSKLRALIEKECA